MHIRDIIQIIVDFQIAAFVFQLGLRQHGRGVQRVAVVFKGASLGREKKQPAHQPCRHQCQQRIPKRHFQLDAHGAPSLLLAQHVAHAAHGMDQLFLKGVVHLFTQAADIDVHHVGRALIIHAPYVFQDAVAR